MYMAPGISTREPGQTYYQVLVGPGIAFQPLNRGNANIRLGQITDGTSNTLMIVKAGELIIWTKRIIFAMTRIGRSPSSAACSRRLSRRDVRRLCPLPSPRYRGVHFARRHHPQRRRDAAGGFLSAMRNGSLQIECILANRVSVVHCNSASFNRKFLQVPRPHRYTAPGIKLRAIQSP